MFLQVITRIHFWKCQTHDAHIVNVYQICCHGICLYNLWMKYVQAAERVASLK